MAIQPNQKKKLLSLMGTLLFLSKVSFADTDPHATGLRLPTPEQVAWEETHMIIPQRIKLNARGLSRINLHRDALGLPRFAPMAAEVSSIGDEIEGLTQAASGGTAIEFSPLAEATSFPSAVDNSALKYLSLIHI